MSINIVSIGIFILSPYRLLCMESNIVCVQASLSSVDESARRVSARDERVLGLLRASMAHRRPALRVAACTLLRSLSRSVQTLRANLNGIEIGKLLVAVRSKQKLFHCIKFCFIYSYCQMNVKECKEWLQQRCATLCSIQLQSKRM